jgi:Ca2+-transporting ATPase
MRREREAPWSSPLFPYLGWIILGWALTWAAVELPMLQRLLDTESLSGAQWAVVLGCSLLAPALVWTDRTIQLRRQRTQAPDLTAAAPADPGTALPPPALAGH